jgi:two-component system, LytTR family, sensor kinase
MLKVKFDKQIIIRHMINWLFVIVMINVVVPFEQDILYGIFKLIVEYSVYIFFYYFFCIHISPRISTSKKYYPLVIAYLLVFIVFFYGIESFPSIVNWDIPFVLPSWGWFKNGFELALFIPLLAHMFYKKEIGIQLKRKAFEDMETTITHEMLFFKNQFNSHISLNFLTYCYSFALKRNDSSAEVIEIYSEMMKYTLHTPPNEMVLISREISYIEKFIELQSKIGKMVFCNFIKSDGLSYIKVPPRIFINYVENAFKYGIYDDPLKPIIIEVSLSNNFLIFKITNCKKVNSEGVMSTKTGYYNSQNQLDLFYPERYKVHVADLNDSYSITLKIQIS